jgi:hypothetical protein
MDARVDSVNEEREARPMAVKPVPDGYHTVTPYLTLDDAAAAIEYYKQAFGAKERVRMDTPDGKVGMPSSRSATRS